MIIFIIQEAKGPVWSDSMLHEIVCLPIKVTKTKETIRRTSIGCFVWHSRASNSIMF